VVRSRALQACGKERCYRLAGPRTLQSPRRKEQWVGVRAQYRRRARLTGCGNVLIFGSAVASRSRQLPPARLGFIRSPVWGDLSRPFIVDKIQWGNYSHECTSEGRLEKPHTPSSSHFLQAISRLQRNPCRRHSSLDCNFRRWYVSQQCALW
jgi:hypothetical protein